MKKIISIILAVILTLSLCACGKSASQAAKSEGYYPEPAAESYAAAATADYDMSYAEYEEAAMEAPAAAYGGFAADNSAADVKVQENETSAINPDKIIYSANAQLETTEFDVTIQKLAELIEACGGFVESSSVNGANYYSQSHGYTVNRSANYTIRIPSAVFSSVMGSLPTLGNVPYTNTYTENISAQYYDVQARLEAYKTQEKRLLEMMEIAGTVEDVITIEDRLTEIRYEIESMQSKLNNWDRKVSYSTLYLDVIEVEEYTPGTTEKVSYLEKLSAAVKRGLKGVADFFADFLLWLLEALPTLIILGILAWILIAVIKKRAATKDERKARRLARKQAKLEKKASAFADSDSSGSKE